MKARKAAACFLAVVLLTAGCGESIPKNTEPEKNVSMTDETDKKDDKEDNIVGTSKDRDASVNLMEDDDEKEGKEIVIYSPNSDATGFTVTRYKDDDLEAEEVMDALEDMGVMSDDDVLLSCVQEGDTIKLNLSKSFQDEISKMGTTGEYYILGSVVNSFIDTFHAKNLLLTIEGEPLQTGHSIYADPMEKFK